MSLKEGLLSDLIRREQGEQSCRTFRRRQQFCEPDIQKLRLDHEFKGHQECVNCLQWNEDGTLLASGSDDTRCCIWDPFRKRKVTDVETGHEANIFSVSFIPHSNSSLIATCAGDGRVKVWDINHRAQIYDDRSHFSRVKRLASAADTPSIFWSAGEDGLVIQHDLRESPQQSSFENRRALISMLAHTNSHECKCLAVNPIHTHLLAVGSNDIYVRLFDRRMLSSKTINAVRGDGAEFLTFFRDAEMFAFPKGCVRYYTAGHLPSKYAAEAPNPSGRRSSSMKTVSVSYIAFSRDGSELLVNYNGEQIYLFNLNGGIAGSRQFLPPLLENGEPPPPQVSRNGFMQMQPENEDHLLDISGARDLKDRANESFHQKNYFDAIRLYNLALKKCPESSVLWSNRSAALMKRKQAGDVYEALLNGYRAFCLNCSNDKACFRIIRNLIDLKRFEEARQWLTHLKRAPHTSGCSALIESSSIQRIERELDEHFNTGGEAAESKSRGNSRSSSDADSSTSSSSSTSNNGSALFDASAAVAEGESSGISLLTTSSRNSSSPTSKLSDSEKLRRSLAFDYSSRRFTGHCNTNTDIKEACFMGGNSQFVVAGSDDGCFYVWDKQTTNILRVMKADSSIVNCCAPHPEHNILATSGIDNVVRLWTPSADHQDGQKNVKKDVGDKKKPQIGEIIHDYANASENNAKLMARDPFERIFLNMRDDMFPIDMILAAANRARVNNTRRRRAAGTSGDDADGDEGANNNNDDDDEHEGGNRRITVPMQCSQQ